jgi:hypothetical protein
MRGNRFVALLAAFDQRSRRRVVGSLSRAALLLSPLATLSHANAKTTYQHAAHARKKRKKHPQTCPECPVCLSPPLSPPVPPPPPPLVDCNALCPGCAFCHIRAEGVPLCSNGSGSDCKPCTSDQDCLGTSRPYCVSKMIVRINGRILDECGGHPGLVCASVPACD